MVYQRTIFLNDTDAAGVVYFASLMSICHEAYESSLSAAGLSFRSLVSDTERAIPVIDARIRFFSPLFCGDKVYIALSPSEIDESEFRVDYALFLSEECEVKVAHATTRHVCINPSLRERISLPESIISWIDSFSEGALQSI